MLLIVEKSYAIVWIALLPHNFLSRTVFTTRDMSHRQAKREAAFAAARASVEKEQLKGKRGLEEPEKELRFERFEQAIQSFSEDVRVFNETVEAALDILTQPKEELAKASERFVRLAAAFHAFEKKVEDMAEMMPDLYLLTHEYDRLKKDLKKLDELASSIPAEALRLIIGDDLGSVSKKVYEALEGLVHRIDELEQIVEYDLLHPVQS